MCYRIIHGLVFAAAVVIPGGLLVYWLWRIKKSRRVKKEKGPKAQKSLPEKSGNYSVQLHDDSV